MRVDKLLGRIRDVAWEPPVLSFKIERHGATVLGSSRAEIQAWRIDLDDSTAEFEIAGYRLVRPRQAPVDVRSAAHELARAIVNREPDSRLKWHSGGRVRVVISVVFPVGSAVKEALQGRRRRFRRALTELLAAQGWKAAGANVFAPPESLDNR